MVLSKDEILNAKDVHQERVNVPEWGGEVIVTTLKAIDRDKFEQSVVGKNGGQNLQNFRARLCAICMVDEEGNLLFEDKDVAKLGRKSASALNRVFEVAQRLNLFSDQDVDELAKN